MKTHDKVGIQKKQNQHFKTYFHSLCTPLYSIKEERRKKDCVQTTGEGRRKKKYKMLKTTSKPSTINQFYSLNANKLR